jgi:hypothetical protein
MSIHFERLKDKLAYYGGYKWLPYIDAVELLSENDRLRAEIETNNKLHDRITLFFKENRVDCVETIHQCDWVIENAYEFMSDLFEIIEPDLNTEEDYE